MNVAWRPNQYKTNALSVELFVVIQSVQTVRKNTILSFNMVSENHNIKN